MQRGCGLSKFAICPRCHKYRWVDVCRCEPFHVDFPDRFGKDGKVIYGTSFEEVVETIATVVNRDEPLYDEYLFEEDITVTDRHGESKRFNCIASLDVSYSVKERSDD